jgi:hypothetical protein
MVVSAGRVSQAALALLLVLVLAGSGSSVLPAEATSTSDGATIVPRGTTPPPPPAAPASGPRSVETACPAGRTPAGGFADTDASVFADEIDCLSWYEVTQGVAPGRFAPDQTVTRRQMAVFLHRWLEHSVWLPAWDGRNVFRDVSGTGSREINVLASPLVENLLGQRIVGGYADGTFRPNEPVSRQQMATFISRVVLGVTHYHDALAQRPNRTCRFADATDISAVHRPNAELLCEFGVAAGRSDGSFAPSAEVRRGQMSAFLMRSQDVFVEAGLSFVPDEVVELVVDEHACAGARADGSEGRAFCTVGDALEVVAARPERSFTVLFLRASAPWPQHVYGYHEDLVLPDRNLAIVGDEDHPSTQGIFGSVIVPGGPHRSLYLERLVVSNIDDASPVPALDVPNGAFVGMFAAGVSGAEVGISLEEGALLLAPNSMFTGGEVAVDVVDGVALIYEGTIAFTGVGVDVWPGSYAEVVDSQFGHNGIGIDLWEEGSLVEGNWFYDTQFAHIVDGFGSYDLPALTRSNTFTRSGATTAPYARIGTFEGAPAILPGG